MKTHHNYTEGMALKIKTLINEEDIMPIYLFSGNMSYTLLNEHLIELKAHLKFSIENQVTRKRIYSVLVEGLDNIYRHGYCVEDGANKYTYGYFVIAKQKDSIVIWMGNYIENKNRLDYQNRLDGIVKQEKSDLTKRIKKQIKEVVHLDSSNAGIGLLDVFRKILGIGTVNYFFDNMDDKLSLFSMEVRIAPRDIV